jgi:hypothetical protein
MVYAGALLLIGLLSACASNARVRYSKPDASVDAVRHDEGECVLAALVRTDDPTLIGPYPTVDRDAFDHCMRSKGYVMREP